MSFLLVHTQVRNDEGCPRCRKWFVGVFETQYQALERARKRISKVGEFYVKGDYEHEEALADLERGRRVWIDEWVRRSNGDEYQIARINNGAHFASSRGVNPGSDLSRPAGFMFVEFVIDGTRYCPDNVRLQVTFHESVTDAVEAKFAERWPVDRNGNIEYCSERLDVLKLNEAQDNRLKTKLVSLACGKPVWLPRDKTWQGDGVFLQICKLEPGPMIQLTDLCKQLGREHWNAHYDCWGHRK